MDVFVGQTVPSSSSFILYNKEGQEPLTPICLQQWEASDSTTEVKEALTIAGVDSSCVTQDKVQEWSCMCSTLEKGGGGGGGGGGGDGEYFWAGGRSLLSHRLGEGK